MLKHRIRLFFFILLLSFGYLSYARSSDTDFKLLIYNEEILTKQLKGRDKKEVLKLLGNPTIRKPCKECKGNLEYWWYNLPKASIFVHFKNGKVYSISVLTENKNITKWIGTRYFVY